MLDLNITLVFQLVNFFIAIFVLNILLIRPIREDHEVEHAPAEIAPARRCVPGFSGDCLRGGHGKDQRQRQDKPEVFPFAQNTPPKRSEK